MAWVKVENNVVVQKQPYKGDGYIEAPESTICGYLYDPKTGGFTAPEPEPVDPLTQTLTQRQIKAALIQSGTSLTPDSFVRTALAAISDAKKKALALNDWESAPYYKRDHTLFSDPDVMAAAGMTSAQIDQLWRLGVTLPA